MAGNSIGQMFRVTTFGESHGLALGCIVDGVPPGLTLTEADLQHDLDRRRPGTSRYTTQRREPDQVKILSGSKHSISFLKLPEKHHPYEALIPFPLCNA